MFRIWGKIFKDNHLVRDMVYENGDTDIEQIDFDYLEIEVIEE